MTQAKDQTEPESGRAEPGRAEAGRVALESVKRRSGGVAQPMMAGVVLAIVGFASSFAVVLAGLRAVGADDRQAASGLLALSVTMGVVAIYLGVRYRMPISIAWSTPGAALLVTVRGVDYREALGAFAVTGALIVLAGMSKRLERALSAIPVPMAAAMLAGVLLPLCVAPVRAVAEVPEAALPVILTWAVLGRFAPTRRWAVPAALAMAIAAILLTGTPGPASWPAVTPTAPQFSVGAIVGVAIPLFVVTMASQNVPGMGVLAANGYQPALRPILTTTGAATIAGAPFGGHAINLAAITAALAAGPDAHPDPDRRWIASVTGGAVYLILGLFSGLAVTLLTAPLLIETVAGLALLGALAAALHTAVANPETRDEAVITFAVTASTITLLGIGAPFWGLVAGLAYRHSRSRSPWRPRSP